MGSLADQTEEIVRWQREADLYTGLYHEVSTAARRVVHNAYGTKPRHTKARDGGCRDDCIPCGLAALAKLFPNDEMAKEVARWVLLQTE